MDLRHTFVDSGTGRDETLNNSAISGDRELVVCKQKKFLPLFGVLNHFKTDV